MFSPNSGRPCAKYPAAAAQAAKVTFMKSGERPIIPHVARAQCDIMTRRRSSSSRVRGTMKDRPTRSPLVGDTYVMSSRRAASCCISYSAAMARTPLASPGCVVTSLTRSPPSQTSRCWSWSPLMYCRPVRAPIVASGSGLARPVHEPPQRSAERAEVEAADAIADGEDGVSNDDGDHHDVLDHEIVHPDELGGALDRVHLGLGGAPEAIVLVVAPPGQVRAGPLVGLLRDFPRAERAHEGLRVRLSQDLG